MSTIAARNSITYDAHAQKVGVIGDRRRLVGDNKLQNPPEKCTFEVYGVPFELDAKYVPVKVLGMGTFGLVSSCRNRKTGESVAIKKIGEALRSQANAVMTLREIQILRQVRHDNIISLHDVMLSSHSKADFRDVYLVQELVDFDLRHAMDYMKLSGVHCKHLLYQILRGLTFLHSANVMHRDLKPENLLVSLNYDLKIADFGHARTKYKESRAMNDIVGTTCYKAPELVVGSNSYENSVDIWSVGCIFAEMLSGRPIFTGRDDSEQINQIFSLLGKQTTDFSFVECSRVKQFLEELSRSCSPDGPSLRKLYGEADPLAVDLLERMLVLNPRKRISAKEALEHPYFLGMHDPTLEIEARSCVRLEVDENPARVNGKMVRELIWREMLFYRPQERDYSLF